MRERVVSYFKVVIKMYEKIVSFFKIALRACHSPELWLINICGVFVGAFFWTGVDFDNPDLFKARVTIIGLLVMAAGSFYTFFRDDGDVRLYQKSKGKKKDAILLSKADIAALQDTPIKAYLYARYSLAKYTSARSLAITWTLLWGALSITAPCNCSNFVDHYNVSVYPPVLFCIFLVALIVTTVMKQTLTEKLTENWFSLLTRPTAIVPNGFEPGVVLCKSPTPLKNWGDKDTYKCEISEIDGNKMPKADNRKDILWRYIPLGENA